MLVWLLAMVLCAGMDTDSTKNVRVPVFSGKQEDFQIWWMRFMAFATIMGFSAVLTTTKHAAVPADQVEDAADTADGKKARKWNLTAMYNITLAFTTEALMGLVFKSQTPEWPSGLAHLVVQGLFNKFRPQDNVSKIEVRRQLAAMKLKDKEDPAKLFERAGKIANQSTGTNKVSDEDMLACVMSAFTDKCHPVITSLAITKGDALTINDLEVTTKAFFRINVASKESANESTDNGSNSGQEYVLSNVNRGGGGNRGGRGGRGRGYSGRGRGNGGRKRCYLCNNEGHLKRDCWELEENANKRPNNWVSKLNGGFGNQTNRGNNSRECSIVSAQNWKCDFIMCTVTRQVFPDNLGLFDDPNIFVADSAATQHVSKTLLAMTKVRKAGSECDSITANSTVAHAENHGAMNMIICDNQGTELRPMGVEQIVHSPDAPFNLISIGRMARLGWSFEGNQDYFHLYDSKGNELIFDIVINTPKGMLWAAYMKRVKPTETGLVVAATKAIKETRMNVKKAHGLLGHLNEDATRKSALHLGWTITRGLLKTCEPCSIAKARQKNLP